MSDKTKAELEKELEEALAKSALLEKQLAQKQIALNEIGGKLAGSLKDLDESMQKAQGKDERIHNLEDALQRGDTEVNRLNGVIRDLQVSPSSPAFSSEDEKEIRRRMSGGISRKHAEEAHAAQVAHNATLAAADED
jgi:paraquat-inducible protein B